MKNINCSLSRNLPHFLPFLILCASLMAPSVGAAFSTSPTEWFQNLFGKGSSSKEEKPTKFVIATSREAIVRLNLKNWTYINWETFTQPGSISRGALRTDLSRIAEDLGLFGLHPDDQIVVVGRGFQGRGEEGRIQWMLKYWGYKNVRLASYQSELVTKAEKAETLTSLPQVKVPKLKTHPDWIVTVEEIKENPDKYIYLDVRPMQSQFYPKIFTERKMNVFRRPWGGFYNPDMSVSPDAEGYVVEAGLREATKPIVVLSHAGLSAAGVALILRELGVNAKLLPDGLFAIQPDFSIAPAMAPNSPSDL